MARPRKSVNITWLGEDDLQHENADGEKVASYPLDKETPPRRTFWNGIEFLKGEPVAISNKHMIEKAKGNRFFSVEGHTPDSDEPAED